MEMLNSLNILAGKISPQNHDENGVVVVVSGSDHHSLSSRFVSRPPTFIILLRYYIIKS